MRRSEVESWLAAHGGQADYKVDLVKTANTKKKTPLDPEQVDVKKVTWTAKDGQTLSVMDYERRDQDAVMNDFVPQADGTKSYDPEYELVGNDSTPGKEDIRTPESKRNDERIDKERQDNLQETGHWETNEARRQRENQENDRARQITNDDRANEIRQQELEIRRQAEERAGRGENRAAESEARRAETDAGRLEIERGRYDLERDKANRPDVISKPTDEDRSIAIFDPVTGTVKAQDNPLYNDAKVKAKEKQEELALAIQQNKLDAETAAQQYSQWFKQNVELPFMQANERRAQATEQRQALEAQQRRKEFAATYSLNREKVGMEAGQDAARNEIALLPYQAGPQFGEQMSSAINSLGRGGSMGANAAAGINFTADAFEFKRPNLDKIAAKATANALKHLTSYTPDDTALPTADYSGINMQPDTSTMPQGPNPIDTRSIWEDWKQRRYAPTAP